MTTLEQVVDALEKRELYEDAFICGFVYPLRLMLLHGVSEEVALKMDVDDVVELLNQPLEAGGWDNFWRGGHYYGRNSG